MKAVIFKDIGTYTIEERTIPQIIETTDVLVEMEAASICGTDLMLLKDPPGFIGKKGMVLGHECVGKVIETGPNVGGLKPGDRVVLEPNLHCGYCYYCKNGEPNMCDNEVIKGVTTDGVFAKYFVAPEVSLTKIPDDMDKDLAVFCEPVNCVMGAVNKVRLLPGESVLVQGAGPIGLIFIMLLKANGAGKIIVSEPSDFRAESAKKCGADYIINPTKQNLAEEVRALTDGRGADVTIDAVGCLSPAAIECTRKAGKVVLFGQNGAVKETICQNDITMKGLYIFGNYIGKYTMAPTVQMLYSGLLPVKNIITHQVNLSEFGTALEALRKGEGLKAILYPEE